MTPLLTRSAVLILSIGAIVASGCTQDIPSKGDVVVLDEVPDTVVPAGAAVVDDAPDDDAPLDVPVLQLGVSNRESVICKLPGVCAPVEAHNCCVWATRWNGHCSECCLPHGYSTSSGNKCCSLSAFYNGSILVCT